MRKILAFGVALLWSAQVTAMDVRMAFGDRIPPFCFPETNSGIELEVIGEALAYRGHQLRPSYYPLARVPMAFKTGLVDAAMTDAGQDMRATGAHYGDSAVVYDNVLITLAERHLKIRTPEDLHGLTVIAFQGAAKRYPQWLGPVVAEGHFFEQNDQAIQVQTLEIGRYDVVLSDRTIFHYFRAKLQQETGQTPKAVVEHDFTKVNPNDYRPLFRDPKVRDDFNAGLRHLKATGRFRQIYDRYLKN